jgi:hypothetical protein
VSKRSLINHSARALQRQSRARRKRESRLVPRFNKEKRRDLKLRRAAQPVSRYVPLAAIDATYSTTSSIAPRDPRLAIPPGARPGRHAPCESAIRIFIGRKSRNRGFSVGEHILSGILVSGVAINPEAVAIVHPTTKDLGYHTGTMIDPTGAGSEIVRESFEEVIERLDKKDCK